MSASADLAAARRTALRRLIDAVRDHRTNHGNARRGECDLCEAWAYYAATQLGEPDRDRAERLEWLL